jgi:hypothetical protein
MLGLYIGYGGVFPFVIDATISDPPSQKAAFLRFLLGIAALLIPYVTLDIFGSNKSLLVASIIRILRFACLPPIAALGMPPTFDALGI